VIGAVLYWLGVVVMMHLLEREFSPIKVPMSAYVLGAYGGWMTTSFFALAAALFAAGYALAMTLPRTGLTWTAFLLFIIAATGVLVAGLFPMNSPESPGALSGRWHALGGLFAFPTMALGPFLFSLTFRRDPRWRRISVPSLTLSGGIIALYFLARVLRFAPGPPGYMQRFFFALLIPWMLLVGFQLIRVGREPT
jgi:hypothetical protein